MKLSRKNNPTTEASNTILCNKFAKYELDYVTKTPNNVSLSLNYL